MDLRHVYIVVASLLVSLVEVQGVRWCAYQDEWKKGHSTITYREYQGLQGDGKSFNFTTGIFTSPEESKYRVTVSAVVGGMLPAKPGDILMKTSPVYAQIFLQTTTDTHRLPDRDMLRDEDYYLLVKEDEVADLSFSLVMLGGETLWLETGHVTTSKYYREAYDHRVTSISGGFLEDVTFCISADLD